jgi:hypothetical protein
MTEPTATELIDAKLAGLGDWREATLSTLRALIHRALPRVVETVKWRKPTNPNGVPVWEVDGILCTGEVYRTWVKLTFMYGAALPDPTGLFNAGFGGGTRRAIDLKEGETIDEAAFIALMQAAAAHNTAKKTKA